VQPLLASARPAPFATSTRCELSVRYVANSLNMLENARFLPPESQAVDDHSDVSSASARERPHEPRGRSRVYEWISHSIHSVRHESQSVATGPDAVISLVGTPLGVSGARLPTLPISGKVGQLNDRYSCILPERCLARESNTV